MAHQAVMEAVEGEQRSQRLHVALSVQSKGPAVLHLGAVTYGEEAGEAGMEGEQWGGGVGAGGGGGVLGGLRERSEARRAVLPLWGDGFVAAIDGGARAREEDERAVRLRAIPQLRGELVDCGVGGRGKHRRGRWVRQAASAESATSSPPIDQLCDEVWAAPRDHGDGSVDSKRRRRGHHMPGGWGNFHPLAPRGSGGNNAPSYIPSLAANFLKMAA